MGLLDWLIKQFGELEHAPPRPSLVELSELAERLVRDRLSAPQPLRRSAVAKKLATLSRNLGRAAKAAVDLGEQGVSQVVLASGANNPLETDEPLVKAIARAFRWREMLENGTHATIVEISAAESINESYVGRVLRLTLLTPDIVEAVLKGQQPVGLQLDGLMKRFPVEWHAQRSTFKLGPIS